MKNSFYVMSNHKKILTIEIEVDQYSLYFLISYLIRIAVADTAKRFNMKSIHRIWRTKVNETYVKQHFWKEKIISSDRYFISSLYRED